MPEPYHVSTWELRAASVETLTKWAADPNCLDQELCANKLAEQLAERAQRLADKRQRLLEDPFDFRTEISADARHVASRVVKHLWIIFVLLPVVLGLLWTLLK